MPGPKLATEPNVSNNRHKVSTEDHDRHASQGISFWRRNDYIDAPAANRDVPELQTGDALGQKRLKPATQPVIRREAQARVAEDELLQKRCRAGEKVDVVVGGSLGRTFNGIRR